MGKFKTHLKCKKNEMIELCPICNSLQKSQDEQPQMGTHVFTIVFECGTEIDFPIGYDGAEYGVTCTGEVKRFDMEDMLNRMSNSKKQAIAKELKEKW